VPARRRRSQNENSFQFAALSVALIRLSELPIPYDMMSGNGKLGMKRNFRMLHGRSGIWAIAVIAALVLLLPNSASVLCVEADGHVMIEDINAGCCVGAAMSYQGSNLPESALAVPESCENCADFLITLNGPGLISNLREVVASGSLADGVSPDCIPHDTYSSPHQSGIQKKVNALTPSSSSAPLRC